MIPMAYGQAWIKFGSAPIPIMTSLTDKGQKVIEEKKDIIEGSGYYLREEHIGCMRDSRNQIALHPRDFEGIKINRIEYFKPLFE